MPDSGKARIRELRPEDGPGVAALVARVGFDGGADAAERAGQPASEGRARPANPTLADGDVELPLGWVIEAERIIVGHIGNLQARYRFRGRDLVVASASGLIVEPDYRGMSIRLVAKFANQPNVDLLLNTTANAAAGDAFKLFRFHPVPSPDYDQALYWVCDAYGFAGVAAARLGLRGPLLALGRPALALAIAARRLWTMRAAGKRNGALRVSASSTIIESSDALDGFWRSLQHENPRLLADRSAAALAWRFDGGARDGRVHFLRCLRDGELIGYAILANFHIPALGLRRLRIVDLAALGEAPDIVDALLLAAGATARSEKCHILEMIGFPDEIRQRPPARGTFVRRLPVWPYLYKAKGADLTAALAAPENWYACPYDGDAAML